MISKLHIVIFIGAFCITYSLFTFSPYYIGYIVGTSMEPQIENYDVLLMKETTEVDVGDVADVKIDDRRHEYSVIHKVVKENDTHIVTKGVNASTPDAPVPKKDIQAKLIYAYNPPDWIKDKYGVLLPDGYDELDEMVREGGELCVFESPFTGEHLGDNALSPICQGNGLQGITKEFLLSVP